MSDVSIYVVGHKPFVLPQNQERIYKPIFVGSGKQDAKEKDYLVDDDGDNISSKNSTFCELTAYYWVWKNDKKSDVIGLCHYRRYFAEDGRMLSAASIDRYLNTEEIAMIVPMKTTWRADSVLEAYLRGAGYQKDLFYVEWAIRKLHPEYLKAFHQVLNSRSAHYRNMLITRRDVFDEYCCWLFSILFEIERYIDLEAYNVTEKRVFGFLSEILLNVYLVAKDLKVVEVPTSSFNVEPFNTVVKQEVTRKIKAIAKRMIWFPTGINQKKWRIC